MGASGRVQNVRHEVVGKNCLCYGISPTARALVILNFDCFRSLVR